MIFDFIKNKDFDGLKKYIETNINDDNLDLDIYDSHHNYFIQYLITYNLIDIIKIILLNKTIRLDIVDTDYWVISHTTTIGDTVTQNLVLRGVS